MSKKYIPVEPLIEYYGTILALALEEITNTYYLCRWTQTIQPEKYKCIPITEDEISRIKDDISDNGFGGEEGPFIGLLFKERKDQAIILVLDDEGLTEE